MKQFKITVMADLSGPPTEIDQNLASIALRAIEALLSESRRPGSIDAADVIYAIFTRGMTIDEAEATIAVIDKLSPLMVREADLYLERDRLTQMTEATFTIHYQHANRATQALVNTMAGVPEATASTLPQRRMRFNKH